MILLFSDYYRLLCLKTIEAIHLYTPYRQRISFYPSISILGRTIKFPYYGDWKEKTRNINTPLKTTPSSSPSLYDFSDFQSPSQPSLLDWLPMGSWTSVPRLITHPRPLVFDVPLICPLVWVSKGRFPFRSTTVSRSVDRSEPNLRSLTGPQVPRQKFT